MTVEELFDYLITEIYDIGCDKAAMDRMVINNKEIASYYYTRLGTIMAKFQCHVDKILEKEVI